MLLKDMYYVLASEYERKEVTVNGNVMKWFKAIEKYGDYRVIIIETEIIVGVVHYIIICKR